jgi:hypothetical protein
VLLEVKDSVKYSELQNILFSLFLSNTIYRYDYFLSESLSMIHSLRRILLFLFIVKEGKETNQTEHSKTKRKKDAS